jgi:TfoX/Sxy family transcriptional regulator of competence genes
VTISIGTMARAGGGTTEGYEARLRRVAPALSFRMSSRRMFGGLMVYAEDAPIASLSPAGFAVKMTGPLFDEAMALPGARPLRYAPDQPPRRHYVVLPEGVVEDDEALARWLNSAAAEWVR